MRTLRLKKNYRLIMGIAIGVIVIAAVLIGVVLHNNGGSSSPTKTGPNFEALLPNKKTIDDLGGWQRISPKNAPPVYAYTDEVEGITITVSQQPLPDSFKADPSGKVAELAKGYNATDTIDADGTKVFIGTSSEGPQSVIFTKNNLLVLIKSKETISDLSWTTYVKSLTGKYSSSGNPGVTY